MGGFMGRARLAFMIAMIATLVVALPGAVISRADDARTDDPAKTRSEKKDLNRTLNGEIDGPVEGLEADAPGGSTATTTESTASGAIAERRGRQPRRGATDGSASPMGLPDGGDDDAPPEEMVICHKPGTRAEKTKVIPVDAWPDHRDHGDLPIACEDAETPIGP